MSAQGCEGQIGGTKKYCAAKGTCHADMPKKVMQHNDITATGMIANNQVDIGHILKDLDYDPLRIYNEAETPMIENRIEAGLPPLGRTVIQLLKNQQINMPMAPLIASLNEGSPDCSVISIHFANDQINSRHDIPSNLLNFHQARDHIEEYILTNRNRLLNI